MVAGKEMQVEMIPKNDLERLNREMNLKQGGVMRYAGKDRKGAMCVQLKTV